EGLLLEVLAEIELGRLSLEVTGAKPSALRVEGERPSVESARVSDPLVVCHANAVRDRPIGELRRPDGLQMRSAVRQFEGHGEDIFRFEGHVAGLAPRVRRQVLDPVDDLRREPTVVDQRQFLSVLLPIDPDGEPRLESIAVELLALPLDGPVPAKAARDLTELNGLLSRPGVPSAGELDPAPNDLSRFVPRQA